MKKKVENHNLTLNNFKNGYKHFFRFVSTFSILLWLVSQIACSSEENVVDNFLGDPPDFIEVPVPESLAISISRPAIDGKKVGWSTPISGTCQPSGTVVEITGHATGFSVCQGDLTWKATADFSEAPIGTVVINVTLKNSNGDKSEEAKRSFNKAHTDCDSQTARDAVFAGGTGASTADPYLICTIAQFNNIRNNRTDHFVLRNDMDFEGSAMDPIDNSFSGTFDGDFYEVSKYEYSDPSLNYVGLFGHLTSAGSMTSVYLYDFDVRGQYYVGSLVGIAQGNLYEIHVTGENARVRGFSEVGGITGRCGNGTTCNMYNVTSTADVTATGNIAGGLAGRLYGQLQSSTTTSKLNYSTGDISAIDYAGGLIGWANTGVFVSDCYASGNITGRNYVGGIGGMLRGVTNCHHTGGSIIGLATGVGGIAGYNYGSIVNSYATSGAVIVSGDSVNRAYVGGLVGYNEADIFNSYATPPVTVNNPNLTYYGVGGLAGRVDGMISGTTATGIISISDVHTAYDIGGIVGEARGTITDSDYTANVISITAEDRIYQVGGIAGRHHTAGDISEVSSTASIIASNTTDYIRLVGGIVGYDYLATNEFSRADMLGSSISISAGTYAEHIGGVAGHVFLATANSLSSSAQIDIQALGGLIRYAGGLIGYRGTAGGSLEVTNSTGNLNLVATTNVDQIGGLIGYTLAPVSSSTANNNIVINAGANSGNVGGLLGYTANGVAVANALATGNISITHTGSTGHGDVGGLIGEARGNIISSIATGYVHAENGSNQNYYGGLAGILYNATSTISDSHARGNVVVNNTAGVTGRVGGLVGRDYGPIFRSSSSASTVSCSGACSYAGGLVAEHYNDVTDSTASASVTGGRYVGGLLGGTNNGTAVDWHLISGSTATGSIIVGTTGDRVGGLIGTGGNYTSVRDSTVNTTSVTSTTSRAGGIYGYVTSYLTIAGSNVTATNITSGTDRAGGLIGHMNGHIGTISASTATVTNINVGTSVGGGLIASAGTMVHITNSAAVVSSVTGPSSADYIAGLVGSIGNNAFISGASASANLFGDDYVGGLLGATGVGVTVTDSYATGSITMTDDYGGGLIGYLNSNSSALENISHVERTFATGSITVTGTSGERIGGLIGHVNADAMIISNLATGDVYASFRYIGGLVGISYGTITDNFATGDYQSDSSAGSIVGYQSGRNINTSYGLGNGIRESGSNTNSWRGVVGTLTGGGTVNSCYKNSAATYIHLPTGLPFTPLDDQGTAMPLSDFEDHTNYGGFTFGVGSSQWKTGPLPYGITPSWYGGATFPYLAPNWATGL